ncbi:MAG: hypothetical protein ACXACF_06390 [Candidatus Hermodarchaeia archaeon]|jgi:hypothetical protein
MQDFGQPPYDFFADSLDDPFEDSMGNPFDPFANPFEAMFDTLGSGIPGSLGALDPSAATNFQGPLADQDNLNMDNLGEMLDSLEDSIEKSPPIAPTSQTNDLDTLLTALEKNIENTSILPEPKIEVELFEDPGWACPTPSIDTPSPPLGIYDYPAIQPNRDERPVGMREGMSKNKSGADDKILCPVENDYISPEACKDKSCEHYSSDTKDCTYYNKGQADL